MQIVIDIPKGKYDRLMKQMQLDRNFSECKITPLPEGHGDLIDVNRKITVPIYDPEYDEWEEKTLTVLEALNRWSDEGVTAKDVIVLADKPKGSTD